MGSVDHAGDDADGDPGAVGRHVGPCAECWAMLREQGRALERLRVQVELVRQAWLETSLQIATMLRHCGIQHGIHEHLSHARPDNDSSG